MVRGKCLKSIKEWLMLTEMIDCFLPFLAQPGIV